MRSGRRRSWLFVAGADAAAQAAAPGFGADVLIQELEDFTPPPLRPAARALAPALYQRWRAAGPLVAVRINPLEGCGREDLEAAMAGAPRIVMMSKVAHPDQVRDLDQDIGRLERALGLAAGGTEIVPNIESAAGLVRADAIAAASPRVTALLVAAEDMVADLGAERTPACRELDHVRSRFLVECVAAGVLAIDCPYTFAGLAAAEADTCFARGLGYKAKAVVNPDQVALVNRLLTPSPADIEKARVLVARFDEARAAGRDRVEVEGLMVEVPTYLAAKRLLQRAVELGVL